MTHDDDYLTAKTERYGSTRDNLSDFERDQLDARAACAERERDDACDELRRVGLELDATNIALRESTRLAAAMVVVVDRVAALHEPAHDPDDGDPDRRVWCTGCGHPYPCATIAAIRRHVHPPLPTAAIRAALSHRRGVE